MTTTQPCTTHEWTPTPTPLGTIDTWTCTTCTTTCATCTVCTGPTATTLQLCETCHTRERTVLARTAHYLTLVDPRDLTRHQSPMAPRLTPRGGHATTTTPDELRAALWGWARLWAGWLDEPDPHPDQTTTWLATHLMWAAHHPEHADWDTYRRYARRTMHAARALAGLAPERLVDRCMWCGDTCVQDREDEHGQPYADGLQDEVRCLGCGLTWPDRAAFQRVVRQHLHDLPEQAPDALVTLEQARMIWPELRAELIRQWRHRGDLTDAAPGRWRVADIAHLLARRADATRPGRRAA